MRLNIQLTFNVAAIIASYAFLRMLNTRQPSPGGATENRRVMENQGGGPVENRRGGVVENRGGGATEKQKRNTSNK